MIITAGNRTYGHKNIKVMFAAEYASAFKVSIGKYCSIAGHVTVFPGNGFHDAKYLSTFPFIDSDAACTANGTTKGNLIIENDVWIGDGSTLMHGIKIGDGAIIAANSHVVKDVKPYSIVGGNPAKFIKYRFSQNNIKKLLEVKWWDWSDKDVDAVRGILHSPTYTTSKAIDELIRVHNK